MGSQQNASPGDEENIFNNLSKERSGSKEGGKTSANVSPRKLHGLSVGHNDPPYTE